MHISRTSNQELVVVDSSIWLSLLLLCPAAFMAVQAVIRQMPNWWLLVGLLGLFALIAWRREAVTFDAARQQVRWVRRRAFKLAAGTVPFSEIRGIGIDSTTDDHGALTYRLTILTSDQPVPMSDVYGGGQAYYDSMRKQVLEFLNLDHNAPSSPAQGDEASIRSLLQQGRKIDAIRLVRTQYQLDLTEAVDRVNEINEKLKTTK